MKKRLITFVLISILLFSLSTQALALTRDWGSAGIPLIKPTSTFKAMTVRWESDDAWYTDGETSVKQWHYFKDTTSAIQYADSLAYAKADNTFYTAAGVALGIASTSTGGAAGILIGGWWCLESNMKTTQIDNLKKAIYANKGKIYVSLRWFESSNTKRSPYISFGAWDGKTIEPGYLKSKPSAIFWKDYLVYVKYKY